MGPLPLGAVNVIVSSSFLCALATISVGLRFLSIHRLKRSVKLHDWLIVVALVCVYAHAICSMIGAGTSGYGLHLEQGVIHDRTQLSNAVKIFFSASIFWIISTTAFRSAIVLLYLDLFGSSRIFRYCCYTLQVVIILIFISGLASLLSVCNTVVFVYGENAYSGCGDGHPALVASAAIATVLDIITVALPLPIIWRLQMAFQKKAAITATLALGLSLCGVNIARLVENQVCNSIDFTYCTAYTLIFMLAETSGGILIACIPTLGPVFFPQRYRPTKNGSSNWRNLDSSGAGKKSRITGAAATKQGALEDDCELLEYNQDTTDGRVELSSDSLTPTSKSHSNMVRTEAIS